MSCVFFREAFASENVAEVSVAVITGYFGSVAVRVACSFYRARNFRVKAWPAATGFEFVCRIIKFRTTAFAGENTLFFVMIILTGIGGLRAFVNYDAFFFGREWIVGGHGMGLVL